ncbi:MAG TPA: tetratricopeptide repeat protein [Candidatus Obscuribacterales bacterium]
MPEISNDPMMQQLLAFDQGRVSRSGLAAWCRARPQVPATAQVLVDFLADSTPERARQLRLQTANLKAWLSEAPLPQRMVLLRICGGFALAGALLLQRDGQLGEAEAMLLLVLDLAPERSAAWLMLAQLQQLQGRNPAALETLRQSLNFFPHDLALLSLQAQLLLQVGLGHQALASYEQVVEHLPDQVDAWLGLGNLRACLGDPDGALLAYRQALELNPAHAGIWNNLGQLHQRRMEYVQAESAYRKALELEPGLVEAWNNLAALELDRGELLEAAAAVAKALALAPDYAPAWLNAGITEGLAGRNGKALAAFARARQLDPMRPEAWLEEASLLLKSKQTDQALSLLQTAQRQLPQSADLCWLHSRLLAYRHLPGPALEAGRRAMALDPRREFRQLQLELGWSLEHFLDLPEEQASWLQQAEQTLARWQERRFGLSELLPELRFLPELLWGLNYIGDQSHLALRRAYARCFDLSPESAVARGSGRGRLRLGVVITSGHEGAFTLHNSGLPLLSHLPASFELVLLGDPARLPADHVPVIPLPGHLPAAVEAIKAAGLDLLYYWEVGSDTLNYFLPFFRLAPVQFSAWGVLMSSGNSGMDYYLSSRLVETEDAREHYSETLLLADGLPLYCSDPRLRAGGATRDELGLPSGVLYVCLQNPLKYSQHFLMALQEILDLDPEAQLVLLASDLPWIQGRVEQVIKQRGLLRQRVHWVHPPMPYSRFLDLFALAAVVLDTREGSGGQTSDDALLMGAPLVSFPGRSARTRVSLGRLSLLGLDDCIVPNWPTFARRACELAHPGRMREKALSLLAQHRGRLLENPAGPEEFAQLLEQMAEEKGLR